MAFVPINDLLVAGSSHDLTLAQKYHSSKFFVPCISQVETVQPALDIDAGGLKGMVAMQSRMKIGVRETQTMAL